MDIMFECLTKGKIIAHTKEYSYIHLDVGQDEMRRFSKKNLFGLSDKFLLDKTDDNPENLFFGRNNFQ